MFEIVAYLWNNQDVREDDGSIEGKTPQRLGVDTRKTFVWFVLQKRRADAEMLLSSHHKALPLVYYCAAIAGHPGSQMWPFR